MRRKPATLKPIGAKAAAKRASSAKLKAQSVRVGDWIVTFIGESKLS
jgi:hypothetical protein